MQQEVCLLKFIPIALKPIECHWPQYSSHLAVLDTSKAWYERNRVKEHGDRDQIEREGCEYDMLALSDVFAKA